MESKEQKVEKVLTKDQEKKLESFKYTSTKIRFLSSLGFDRGPISKILSIRYQHVRNVLLQKVKNPIESF